MASAPPDAPAEPVARVRRVKRRTGRLRPPWPVLLLAGVAVAFFALPLAGLIRRADWSGLGQDLGTAEVRDALWLSVQCSLAATGCCVLFGVPLAWVLARVPVPGRAFVRALVLIPMVLPPVVGGVALLAAFGRSGGLVGGWLGDLGVQLTFHPAGAVVAETFVAMPFLVLTVEGGLRSIDPRFEEAAAAAGASRWSTFRRVTLRLLAPALVAGTALAWARALGEFGATITFAGNVAGRTRTAPLAVYLLLGADPAGAVALSLVLLAVALVVLVALRDRWFRVGR